MSKKPNDNINDSSENDHSEFESSHGNENSNIVKNEISQKVKMDTSEFEAKLTEFFMNHKKSKLGLVSRIAFEFKGDEEVVLEHLHNKYVLGSGFSVKPEKKIKIKTEAKVAEETSENISSLEEVKEVKPKSKKKVVKIIVILLILALLGGAGFVFKDKILGMIGMGGKAHETEAPKAESAPTVIAAEKEAAAAEVVVDSAATAPADTTITK